MRLGLSLVVALIAWASASPLRAEVRNPYGVAVIIGNKTYQSHDIPEVAFADRDAQSIRAYVLDVLGYSPDNVIYLENATQAQLLSVFGSESDPEGKLANYLRPGKKSDVLVYYSGHGVPASGPHDGDTTDAQADLLPADADPNTLGQNGFPVRLLLDNLKQLDARSVTVLLDACFSGMSGGGTLLPHASVMTRPAAPLRPGEAAGMTVITAAQSDQLANWDTVKKHGLFTEYFLEAVYGKADDAQYGGHGDGRITLGAVQHYLDDEMTYTARRQFGRRQKATVTGDAATVLASFTPDRPVREDEATPPSTAAPTASAPAAQVAVVTPPPPQPPPQPQADQTSAADANAKGMSAYNNKDYTEAMRWFRKAADQGNANAQGNIGWLYHNGQGLAQDYAEAMRWYRKAADQGDAVAQNNIGTLYARGSGVAQDYAEAMRWFRKAADQGNANAQGNIGWLYDNGQGLAQDYAEAMRWYRKAADQGDAGAQNIIGTLYARGSGVAQDYAEAMRWYRMAADQGDAVAQYNIGKLYLNGSGVAKNLDEARRWFRLAAAQGDPKAKEWLAKNGN